MTSDVGLRSPAEASSCHNILAMLEPGGIAKVLSSINVLSFGRSAGLSSGCPKVSNSDHILCCNALPMARGMVMAGCVAADHLAMNDTGTPNRLLAKDILVDRCAFAALRALVLCPGLALG